MPDTSAFPPELAALGWDKAWVEELARVPGEGLRPARVARVDRGWCTLMTGAGEERAPVERGVDVAVGDWAAMEPPPAPGEPPRIAALLPRRQSFRRAKDQGRTVQVVAANIDTVLLCDALDGALRRSHLERYVALARQSGTVPVVVITKSDMASADEVADAVEKVEAVAAGVAMVVVSSATGAGIDALGAYLQPGTTAAILGLSGAGKSTLVNLLAGEELLATGEVRRDGKGRHTTSHRQLILLPGGGLVIDTPGMRGLSLTGAAEGVRQNFDDLEALAEGCRYGNCSHGGEEGCAVAAAVADGSVAPDRLQRWLQMRAEPAVADHAAARQEVDERKRRRAARSAGRRSRP